MQTHKQAKKYLAACDSFLCPAKPNFDGTRFFGSPTKLFEYMSLGKPVIASNLEQISDIMNPALKMSDFDSKNTIEDQVGVLVKPEASEFIKSASYLINLNQSERDKLGKNARKKINSQFTWNQHVIKIKKFVSH